MGHTTTDYKSGVVIVSVRAWDGETPPLVGDEWRDLGNVVNYSEEPKITKKKHIARRTPLAVVDKKIPVKGECAIKITLDELNMDNLALFYSATQSVDGNTLYMLNFNAPLYYEVKIEEQLISGVELLEYWYKVELGPSAALEKVIINEGDDDWEKLELTGEVLDDSVNHPTGELASSFGTKAVAETT